MPNSDTCAQPTAIEPDAHERVLAGMELIRWQYALSAWRWHLHHCALPGAAIPERRDRRDIKKEVMIVAGCVTAGGLAGGTLLPAALVASGGVVGGVIGFGAALAVVAVRAVRYHRGRRALTELPPPEVLLTSTGLLFGDVARLWSGSRARLHGIHTEEGDPNYLIVSFEAAGRVPLVGEASTPLYIPVPEPIVGDVAEIVRMLTERLQHGFGGASPGQLVGRSKHNGDA